MQRQGESEAAHQERLRPLFPFRGAKEAARLDRPEAASPQPQQQQQLQLAKAMSKQQAAVKPPQRRPASAGKTSPRMILLLKCMLIHSAP